MLDEDAMFRGADLCLTITGAGEPGHPLYLRSDCKPVKFDLAGP
jgi:hypothetical protein